MAYDEELASRIRQILSQSRGVTEKKMFGGVCFLLNGKMVCGVLKDELIAKIGRENHERVGARKHVRPFDFSGKPMMGMVYVAPEGLTTEKKLSQWIEMAKDQIEAGAAKGQKRIRSK
ncbi:MAG TPA: TfoX/Sxy family protein [Spirochaetia bacterium]|nr:TfoX/Sxy family protein [Spirochaetia bacterium]